MSPTKLAFLTFAQVVFAYLFFIEEWSAYYSMELNYGGLILWAFAFFGIFWGAFTAKELGFVFEYSFIKDLVAVLDSVSAVRLRIIFFVTLICLVGTVIGIYMVYGDFPIFMLANETKHISLIVEDQEGAAPGLFGLHRVFTAMASSLFCIALMRSVLLKKYNEIPFVITFLFVAFAGVVGGKREELVIFLTLIFFSFVVSAYIRDVLWKELGLSGPVNIRSLVIFAILGLLFLGIMRWLTYIRLNSLGDADMTDSEILRYISLPLINLNAIWFYLGLEGFDFDALKPLALLLPAKLVEGRDSVPFNLPEPTSPLGFFATSWVYWGGALGVVVYSFVVGFFSQYVYSKVLKSPFFMVLYGFVGWDIVVSHTHNHFLTNAFLPSQIFILFVLSVFLVPFNVVKKV